ncbi:MAG: enoyl-CoA hydratase/isomerase family protein, partial [Alphaproteobacteria bacterium]
IALVDGIAMGGGVGISVHGSHRIASERTLFAMPETGIGLIPDVGGGYFMPRLAGKAGMFLALSGTRLKAADCLAFGIATHYVPSDRLERLIAALADADLAAPPAVDAVIADFVGDPGPGDVINEADRINEHFAGDSVETILDSLDGDGAPWAQEMAKTLRRMSPTSMKLTFRQMREGAGLNLRQALMLEYRIVSAIKSGHDFYEGVRAQLIDKDRNPKWQPATLAEVTPEMVDAYFQEPPWGDLRFQD